MPRHARVVAENAIYHVYNRLAHGADIFADAGEADCFVDLLARARERDGFDVLAWCLMPSHYHLAVRTGTVPLARSLGFVQARFALDYNRRVGSFGPLWQSRYRAKLVENDRYLKQLVAYIHLNPVATRQEADPAQYRWSGHREVLGLAPTVLVDVVGLLDLFAVDRRDARRAYLATLQEVHDGRFRSLAPGRLPWWRRGADQTMEPDGPSEPRRRASSPVRHRLSAEALLAQAARHLDIDARLLRGAGKGREISVLRYLIASVAVERWGVGTKALAEVLGRRADAVTRWVRCGAKRRRHDPDFRRACDELDAALAASFTAAGA